MPTISTFYGITIRMNQLGKEHNPPHIHAYYSGEVAEINIKTKVILSGSIPKTAYKLVSEFIEKYENELLSMWNSGKITNLPPID